MARFVTVVYLKDGWCDAKQARYVIAVFNTTASPPQRHLHPLSIDVEHAQHFVLCG